jgi:hypothetical protein
LTEPTVRTANGAAGARGNDGYIILTEHHQVHPADVLALQLDRVSSVVRTLGDLYAPHSESFAAGNSFIAHGLVAATTLIADAQEALENLHHLCDLRMSNVESEKTELNSSLPDEAMVFPPPETVWQEPEEPGSTVQSATIESSSVATMPVQAVEDDQFAQSYLELLRKLTAAEVFAAEQQALAPPGSGQNLLPLLRSLREEFQKLHRVA